MLYAFDLYVAEQMMRVRAEEEQRRAEFRTLLRQAGIERQGWLSRPSGWLLCQLGRLLVALGERLKRYGRPESLPLKAQMNGG